MTKILPIRSLRSLDLFAGAGGLSLGFEREGFRPLLANDFDPAAAETFRANFRDTPYLCKGIESISAKEFRDTAGLVGAELDVLLGGPPCQAFSVYNHQRGFHDERSGLFREYLRVVEALTPKVVVMENVVGMTSLDGGRAIEEIYRSLQAFGYVVDHRILRAEDYGVPQERRRVFVVGSRIGNIKWPLPTHGSSTDLLTAHLTPFVSVEDAIGDLPKLAMGEGTDEVRRYTRRARSEFSRLMREGSAGVANHFAPQLGAINVARIKHIPQGGSWRDLPHELLPAGMKKARRSDHTKRYGRLAPDGLFSTILTKADLHWGAYIHPFEDRTLTVRECARAQSFPDTFVFKGVRGDQYRQIGNAVPPLLAAAVAREIRAMISASASAMRPRTNSTRAAHV